MLVRIVNSGDIDFHVHPTWTSVVCLWLFGQVSDQRFISSQNHTAANLTLFNFHAVHMCWLQHWWPWEHPHPRAIGILAAVFESRLRRRYVCSFSWLGRRFMMVLTPIQILWLRSCVRVWNLYKFFGFTNSLSTPYHHSWVLRASTRNLLCNQWPVFLVTRAWQCYIYVTGFAVLVFLLSSSNFFWNFVLKINRVRRSPVDFGFKSLARYRLAWLMFFEVLFNPSNKMKR